jgi:hypothetical protein
MVAKIGNNGKDFAPILIRRIISREELRNRPHEKTLAEFLLRTEGLFVDFDAGCGSRPERRKRLERCVCTTTNVESVGN